MINRLLFVILVIAAVYVAGVFAFEIGTLAERSGVPYGSPMIAVLVCSYFGSLFLMAKVSLWVCFNKRVL